MHKSSIIILFVTTLALGACSSGHEPLKSPCPPLSGFFGSPCDASPLNIFTFRESPLLTMESYLSWIR